MSQEIFLKIYLIQIVLLSLRHLGNILVTILHQGGSFTGVSRALREENPDVKCYVVEPESAAVLAGHDVTNQNHKIQGGGYSMPELKYLEGVQVDGFIQISDDEAVRVTRRLAQEEGLFSGFSSGAP